MKEYILFDLDGTLTNPKVGITRAIQYAMKQLGEPVEPMDALISFIGPPLAVSFAERGYDEEKTAQAIAYYRDYFTKDGMFENDVYDGIEALLQQLKTAGKTLAVATSKPEIFAETILAHFELMPYFDVIVGSELDGRRSAKADVIAEVLQCLNVHASQCVMIGDRKHDMIGARTHHMTAIGVTYGYGDAQELTEAGADFICHDVRALQQLLLEQSDVSKV